MCKLIISQYFVFQVCFQSKAVRLIFKPWYDPERFLSVLKGSVWVENVSGIAQTAWNLTEQVLQCPLYIPLFKVTREDKCLQYFMPKVLLDQYLLSNNEKKNGFTTELRREQQYISQSTQSPSRVLQLGAFLNCSYLTAPSGFLFHKVQDQKRHQPPVTVGLVIQDSNHKHKSTNL